MKRDMELIRKILLAAEEDCSGGLQPTIEGHAEEEIQYHVGLLRQAGLINSINASSLDRESYIITGLTWEGHDFIDAARNETVWRKALHIFTERGGGMTFELMKQLLTKLLSERIFGPGSSGGPPTI